MKKIISGVVVKISGNKTVKIKNVRKEKDPKYLKSKKVSRHFLAHDEKNLFKIGDTIKIIESRPISKHKRFIVIYD